MEANEDMDSLFAGMDFVNPISFTDADPPLSSPPSSSAPLDLYNFSSEDTPHTEEHDAKVGPIHQILAETDQKLRTHGNSIESILAAYDSVAVANPKVSHSLTKTPSNANKQEVDATTRAGVRRKRRSVKIGYGRTDDVDEARSTTSGQDDTASIGSSMDDQGISLAELESASGRHEMLTLSMSNGDSGSHAAMPDTFEVQSDTDTADILISQVPSPDLCIVRNDVDEVSAVSSKSNVLELDAPCLEETEADPVTKGEPEIVKDNRELSSTLQVLEKGDVSIETICRNGNDSDIGMLDDKVSSSHIVADEAHPVSETDVLELGIMVPLELSIEERFDFIKGALAKNVECFQQRIAAISGARKAAAQKRRQVAEKVTHCSAKVKEVEEEIEVACEREDFEKAESLSEALAEAEKALEIVLEEFRAAETDYDKYANEMQEVLQMQIRNDDEGLSLMEQLAHAAALDAEDLKKESGNKGKINLDALTVEEEAVKVKKKKLILEVKVVEEAKLELIHAIECSSTWELQEKKNLMEQQQVLRQELEALLEAVRFKETQIAEHDKKIKALDEKINGRVAGFEKENSELEVDLETHLSLLDALEREAEGLISQKLQVEAEVAHAQEAAEKMVVVSSTAKMEAQRLHCALEMRKAAAQSALTSKEKRLNLVAMEKQHVEDAHAFRSRSSALRTSLQELASEKIKSQQELLSTNQQISSIEKRGPEIEAEKKMAAASRNFKEAARLAAESKALLSSKEKLRQNWKRVSAGLEALNQELESRMSELSNLDNELQGKEKEAAMARCERLRLLAAATRDERDAAVELEDFEEAESLDMEAEAADREAEELQRAFGFEGEMYSRLSSRGGDPSTREELSNAKQREEVEKEGRCETAVELADADSSR